MANRTFYAVHAIGFAPLGSASFTEAHGVQSVAITTTFNLEQVFELGQIELYENVENVPDIEMTSQKVMDGYPPLYLLCTQGASASDLAGRSVKKVIGALSIYDDAQSSASGTPLSQCNMSGLAISALSYSFPADGNFTEDVTLVGNDKTWKTSSFTFSPSFLNTDVPLSLGGTSGGVQRREDLVFIPSISNAAANLDANSHIADPNCTILPAGGLTSGGGVAGISSSGTNNKTADVYGTHVTNISVSTDLGREEIFELGRRLPYYRFVSFPTEVTCEIEILATQGDLVQGTEAGIVATGSNLSNKSIRIATREGLRLNLGTKNKLQSVNYAGGDTGGGNVTCTYSYSNFNSLDVKHWNDVTAALAPAQYTAPQN